MKQPRIHNLHMGEMPSGYVLVDRRTIWGNPYVIGKDGGRSEVVQKFSVYAKERIVNQPTWLEPLRGKDLACWCIPARCHAEVLRDLANRPVVELE